MAVENIQVPDLGTDDEVEVIEVLVKAGDSISENDSLVVLESDKAAMDIPAPKSGVVKTVLVKVGAQVKTGVALVELETEGEAAAEPATEAEPASETKPATEAEAAPAPEAKPAAESVAEPAADTAPVASTSSVQQVLIPDLGTDEAVEVIDILVKPGDEVGEEGGLITLETDKAAMDVPAQIAGVIKSIKVKVGDKVKAGDLLAEIESTSAATAPAATPAPVKAESEAAPAAASPAVETTERPVPQVVPAASSNAEVYAGPAVRKLARELGVDLTQVGGTGLKGRIQKEDIHEFVKSALKGGAAQLTGGASGIPGVADIDFSKFGEIEEVEMTKLHRITAQNMTKCWLNVPHVTQFDEADITDLEDFRAAQKKLAEKKGVKLTPLPFIIKACAQALVEYPQFNVSLHSSGSKLIKKKYVNIGVAVATPAGLMVPVVKNADRKSVWEIAAEVAELGAKAKDRKLGREDMEGACFTVSSLGPMGGSGFTPIVSSPEVAILGVSRASIKPVWKDGEFVPRTLMPYSLSYDHRAVNGVDGGLFCTFVGQLLSDIRLMVL